MFEVIWEKIVGLFDGCSHHWEKWEVTGRAITFFYQERECLLCGKRQIRKVGN
jgi:hypothetical protein